MSGGKGKKKKRKGGQSPRPRAVHEGQAATAAETEGGLEAPARRAGSRPAEEEGAGELSLGRRVLREPLALGLAAVAVARPWLDGIVHPLYNIYFFWGVAVLFMAWAVHVVFKGGRLGHGWPMALLAGFLIVALAGASQSIQLDNTYRNLLYWAGYFFLFAVAAHALRTRLAVGIVLGAFLAVSLAEVVWAVVHFHYVLPFTRWQVANNPQMMAQFFDGSAEMNAELTHRLSVNRAFGSLLFPNALGAFLVLGIPLALGAAVYSWRRCREITPEPAGREGAAPMGLQPSSAADGPPRSGGIDPRLFISLVAGLITWLAVFSVAYFITAFVRSIDVSGASWAQSPVLSVAAVWIAPVAAGLVPLVLIRMRGVQAAMALLRAWVLPLLAALQLYTLYLTYSRGAMLGLAAALALGAALLWWARWGVSLGPLARRTAPAATVLLLACAGLATLMGAAAPSPGEPGAPPGPPQAQQQAPGGGQDVSVEGLGLTMSDLASPATLELRFSYWRTGWLMAWDNLWSGVGLGNFAVAYPNYQYLGAGDVRMAHNDYLQVLCETGLLGALLFCGFWGYVGVWGARRIRATASSADRWLLCGLYAGIVAFLVHSLVDFNFYNPSLATLAFLLTGCFFALAGRASGHEAPAKTVPRTGFFHPAAAIVLLSVAAIGAGAGYRLWANEITAPDERKAGDWIGAATFFAQHVHPTRFNPQDPPAIRLEAAALLFEYRDAMEEFGVIRVPVPVGEGTVMRLLSHAPDATAEQLRQGVLEITNPDIARVRARAAIQDEAVRLEAIDSAFPYDPELAAHIHVLYDRLRLLANGDESVRREATLQSLQWAEEAVERSPRQAWFRTSYAEALWHRGNLDGDQSYFEQGLEQYQKATELSPIYPGIWRAYAGALREFARAHQEHGVAEEARRLTARAEEAEERAAYLQRFRENGGVAGPAPMAELGP